VSILPPRSRLESTLDGALAHRLTVLVADAGFGKTTLLSSWSAGINAVVYPVTGEDRDLTAFWRGLVAMLRRHLGDLPELPVTVVRGPASAHGEGVRAQAMAELLGQVLEERLSRDLVLVLDDAHLVGEGPPASLLAGLARHAPPLLHLVLSTRVAPAIPTTRLRAQGQVLEVTGAQLAFTTTEVAALLSALIDTGAGELAEEIRSASGGWPIAVRLSVEALRDVAPADRPHRVARLAAAPGQVTGLLREIYTQEPPPARRVLAIGALLGPFTAGLCEALGVPDAAGTVESLARRGLFVEPLSGTDPSPGPGQWYRLHPLVRRFLTAQAPLPEAEAVRLHGTAAGWLLEHGQPAAALRSLAATGAHERVAASLARIGDQLVASGQADVVIRAIRALPPAHQDTTLDLLSGNAHLVRGDWDEALASYRRAAGGDRPRQPPGLAWRTGLIHYLRGEHEQALAAYQRGDPGGPPTRDAALLLAWTAAAHWIRGDLRACGDRAAQALRTASAADDPAALAAAHTVLSMLAAMEGDRRANAAHYRKALEYAERAGDVLQLIRIHTNQASHHLEEGGYVAAMAELDTAIRLADLSSYGAFGGMALCNRAEIRLRLGQLEEAQQDVNAAVEIFDELGSRMAAYPLLLLGRLQQLRGDRAAARRAYERALAHAEHSGDLQATQPALAGLARVLAGEDGERARSLAERALAYGAGMGQVEALLAAARVAEATGDRARACELARAARSAAGTRRDRAGTAEALEIEAAMTDDNTRARELAGRSAAVWAEIGDPIGQAGADLTYADRLDDAAARAVVEGVRRRMGEIGCRWMMERADTFYARHPAHPPGPVRVETLGILRLLRDGVTVPAPAWRSRKARDILKILLARRGRPVTREFLMETLWPGEATANLANRLHVAVSTLRSVLDPDHRFDGQRFVATDDDTVRARLEHLEVDVESFLDDANTGLALLRAGRTDEALPLLVRAESGYRGDFLEEDLYADWAVPLREQARAAYLAATARLAQHAREAGDIDAVTRYLLRILEHDPYDERAHLRLVETFAATGRHGDARRHYRLYCARMEELEVEAAPFPGRAARVRG
jgi:ATP/maltotriose-dependent transcriptional regulator MalT/DNA-binding SARP family transcriptional activator